MNKHESREDEEDYDALEENINKINQQRWLWCKARGHTIDRCPKDPNFRFGEDSEREFKRILKIGGNTSLGQSEKAINTSILLK